VNQPKQVESYLSSEGVGVLAALLIIGGILLGVTGSGKFTVVLFLLGGIALAALAWMRRPRPGPQRPTTAAAARPEAPPVRPAARPEPAPPDSARESRKEPPPEPPREPPPVEPAAAALPPAALAMMKALEAKGDRATGRTVRVESLMEEVLRPPAVHLVITGDGDPREVWFGKDAGDAWPDEIVVGRMPPGDAAGVTVFSKAVSAQQARFIQRDGAFYAENLSRTNPTRVDGHALQDGEQRPLQDGSRIDIGPVTISYRLE
jgi:FHA domain